MNEDINEGVNSGVETNQKENEVIGSGVVAIRITILANDYLAELLYWRIMHQS